MADGFEAAGYGDVFAELLGERRLNPLDGGAPNDAARRALEQLSVDSAFAGKPVTDASMAQACLSAAWLYHNFLDDSHTISQGVETETGSFWHGIMHRREPDFRNSKYWFQKVEQHPVFPGLAGEAVRIAGDTDLAATAGGAWDPFAYVDLCEAALSGEGPDLICREIQQREFELLFDYSYLKAIGE